MQNKEKKRILDRKRKQSIVKWFHDYKKTLSCEICGEDNWACLDFHHVGIKNHGISNMVRSGYAISSILKEIELTMCVCSNCHRKIHNDENIDKYLKHRK